MWDDQLDQYYLRARWYDPVNGRFNRIDPFEGQVQDPRSLHRYLYAHCNPIRNVDPSGQFSLIEKTATLAGKLTLMTAVMNYTISGIASYNVGKDCMTADGLIFNIGGYISPIRGGIIGPVASLVFDFKTKHFYGSLGLEAGVTPLSVFKKHKKPEIVWSFGPIFNMEDVSELGLYFEATWPVVFARFTVPKPFTVGNKWWSRLMNLAKYNLGNTKTSRKGIIQIAQYIKGPVTFAAGGWTYSFSTTVGYQAGPWDISAFVMRLPDAVADVIGDIQGSLSGLTEDSPLEYIEKKAKEAIDKLLTLDDSDFGV
jgi:RHS repeat-associated protein